MEKYTYPTFFVDVDMFYKSAHHCLYQVCRVKKLGRNVSDEYDIW